MEYNLKEFIDKLNEFYEKDGDIQVTVITPKNSFALSDIDIGTDGEGTLYLYGKEHSYKIGKMEN